jgi:hypothetical protein
MSSHPAAPVLTDEELALLVDRWIECEGRKTIAPIRLCDQVLLDLLRRGTAPGLVARCGTLLEMSERADDAEAVRRFEAAVDLARAVRSIHGVRVRSSASSA